MSDPLDALVEAIAEEGGLLGAALAGRPPACGPSPARWLTGGPRVRGREADYALVVEAIYEGYLLHYGQPRVLRVSDDGDLALLAGDHLYALGLARLVEIGDVEAVTELADVISLAALARAGDDAELAEAVWEAGMVAIAWGAGGAGEEAKERARAGAPEAPARLRAAAMRVRGGANAPA